MFSEELREEAAALWQASFDHDFIQELVAGTLDEQGFRYYLLQDCYYLIHFSEAHGLLAAKTADEEIRASQLALQKGMEEGEIAVRERYFKWLGITKEEYQKTVVAPSAYEYVNHLYRQLATGTVGTSLAALLPCYWLYLEIGQRFSQVASPNPLYQDWINTYDSPEFAESTRQQISLLNQLSELADEDERLAMKEAFLISSQYELAFWEMSYTRETWQFEALN
ncbi:thiaminase II [uncultured Vagococcus sp.]|uniref:thiaminase II n=1 Tax=uncultured Vagococcus sp. TaxID=189676 RepID=UPI0028D1EFF8|nr:thiaminase II [uncultured Vagococcus sp.]